MSSKRRADKIRLREAGLPVSDDEDDDDEDEEEVQGESEGLHAELEHDEPVGEQQDVPAEREVPAASHYDPKDPYRPSPFFQEQEEEQHVGVFDQQRYQLAQQPQSQSQSHVGAFDERRYEPEQSHVGVFDERRHESDQSQQQLHDQGKELAQEEEEQTATFDPHRQSYDWSQVQTGYQGGQWDPSQYQPSQYDPRQHRA